MLNINGRGAKFADSGYANSGCRISLSAVIWHKPYANLGEYDCRERPFLVIYHHALERRLIRRGRWERGIGGGTGSIVPILLASAIRVCPATRLFSARRPGPDAGLFWPAAGKRDGARGRP